MNIKDIAKLAGVSVSTVSKIVNKKDDSISPETRERVLKIVKEYNYSPYSSNNIANSKPTWVIGILLNSSISLDSTLDGIMEKAQQYGYSTLVYNNSGSEEQELKNITSLCKTKVDGIIWEPVAQESLDHLHYLEKLNVPIQTIGPNGGDNSLLLPYEDAAYRLTQELIQQKHKKIACLVTQGRRTSAFINGYKKCLFDNHLNFDPELVFNEISDSLVHKISNHDVSGIITSHYFKALELYSVVTKLGMQIPDELSLVSLKNDYNEITFSTDTRELSTITIKNADFGNYLCDKLIQSIEKKNDKRHSFLQDFQLDNLATLSKPFDWLAPQITVVGSINIDTYLNTSQLPHDGATIFLSNSSVLPGGKGINQAIGVAKLGHRVKLIGTVGADLNSDCIYKILEENGISINGIKRTRNTDTGKAYIFVDAKGSSMISVLPGANNKLSPEDLQDKKELFNDSAYCLIQTEIPLATVEEACNLAHAAGAQTILKPAAYSSIPASILSKTDILVPNEDELNRLCPENISLEEKAAKLLNLGIKAVVVTCGNMGSYVKSADISKHIPASDFPAVDSTGASDAFISAFASYLLYGFSLEDAVKIATYAAGFSISRDGVVNSLVDKQALESYISKRDLKLDHNLGS